MKRPCEICGQERIVCDAHGRCEHCDFWFGCFAWAPSVQLPRSSFPLKLQRQRGEIGFELCLLALVAFFAFHLGAFGARQGDALIEFLLKAVGL